MRLYIIHLFAILAVWLSTFYPGFDIFASLLYMLVITMEARYAKKLRLSRKIIILIAWQAIPAFFSILTIFAPDFISLTPYAIFMLELWYTPLVPLISLAGIPITGYYPLYYYILLIMPVLQSLYYLLASLIEQKKRIR